MIWGRPWPRPEWPTAATLALYANELQVLWLYRASKRRVNGRRRGERPKLVGAWIRDRRDERRREEARLSDRA